MDAVKYCDLNDHMLEGECLDYLEKLLKNILIIYGTSGKKITKKDSGSFSGSSY